MKIGIIDYGAGNLGNVRNALNHIGISSEYYTAGETYDGLILPGVGAFDPAIQALRKLGLDTVITNFIAGGKPFLGICLGMQLMCSGSDEGVESGLGIFSARIVRLPDAGLKIPNIGWSRLNILGGRFITEPADVYFVHSYYLPVIPQTTATINYGAEVTAAVEQDNVFGVQFHPERSGEVGLNLLRRFAGFCNGGH